jgi:hypothetical protein
MIDRREHTRQKDVHTLRVASAHEAAWNRCVSKP